MLTAKVQVLSHYGCAAGHCGLCVITVDLNINVAPALSRSFFSGLPTMLRPLLRDNVVLTALDTIILGIFFGNCRRRTSLIGRSISSGSLGIEAMHV